MELLLDFRFLRMVVSGYSFQMGSFSVSTRVVGESGLVETKFGATMTKKPDLIEE
jgi:hypothetical protein